MFSGLLMVAVLVAALLQVRTNFNRALHKIYDERGMFELALYNAPEEIVDDAIANEKPDELSFIYVLGKTGTADKKYTYGYIEDSAGLAHIPFESGRFPLTENEIAIDRTVLERLGWLGKTGDTIALDSGEYTVVGIIDKTYGMYRSMSEINVNIDKFGDNTPLNPIPMLYVGRTNAAEKYKIVLMGSPAHNEAYVTYSDRMYEDERIGENVRWYCAGTGDPAYIGEMIAHSEEYRFDMRWIILVAGVAALVAVLSVFCVLRSIFLERANNIALLRKIGVSGRSVRLMYAVECLFFILIQTVAGIAIGIAGYLLIYKYQVNILDMTNHSGLTRDTFVTSHTHNPFIIACVFSAFITLTAYMIMAMSSIFKKRDRRAKKKAGSLFSNLGRVFRQRSITAIQTVALTLICFGTLLGYIYYTDSGKTEEYISYTKPYLTDIYSLNMTFDLEKDGLAEYYFCSAPSDIISCDTFSGSVKYVLADGKFTQGVRDDTIRKLNDVVAAGKLLHTFIVCDEPNMDYINKMDFSAEDEKKALIGQSGDKGKSFFDAGQTGTNNLYRVETKLTDEVTLSGLAQYVVDGSIDIGRLSSGSEVIAVCGGDSGIFKAGEELEIGSLQSNGSFGIKDVVLKKVKVGAVAVIPEDADKFLLYTSRGEYAYNLLTTAGGASAMGLYNAAYTEIYAKNEIDGGLIPTSAFMELKSYEQLKHDYFIEKALIYGGLAMVIVLMSLLGFAAYFSGIGMKIRIKTYQISVLRALGTPTSLIRRRLFLESMKIPLIATALSAAMIKAVQRICLHGYNLLLAVVESGRSGDTISFSDDMEEKIAALVEEYFIWNRMWVVPIAKPLIIMFLIMCAVTGILTMLALRKFKGDIAGSINGGRERQ